ncbi:hypothetical protein PTI98_008995 [Pleurotus ostreatus]|nr:hypothetical protein PTI98_008995 [Pleurotus ostreatus]
MGLLKASSKPKPKGFSQTVWKKTANGKRRRVEVIRPLSLSPPPSPSTPRTPHKSSSVRSTPQSLAGAKRHQTQEPVGNWPELDDILEEAGFNEFDFSQFNLYGKTSGDYVQEWMQHKMADLQEIINMEALPHEPTCILCCEALDDIIFRYNHCFSTQVLCSICCLESHRRSPFHHIQTWKDGHFKDCDLNELGLVVNLGHGGKECPAARGDADVINPFMSDNREQSVVIVHTTGIYTRIIKLCSCQDCKSPYVQLLQARLFPATSDRPSTVFTFEVLEELHLQRIECKTASSNFYSLLRRKTDFNAPADLPDRAREMERVSRCYRDLKSKLHAGCWTAEGNTVGGQAIFCPACPQPGVNVTNRTWDSKTDPKWLLSPLLVADGNFKFDHLQLKKPHSDIQLRDGTGYVVTTATYEEHLAITNGVQEKSDCANHKAVNQATRPRKHVDNTGIGVIACARHGFFVPHSIVNFKKGEQQKNMDFALSEAMKFFTKLRPIDDIDTTPSITVIYDVMCQYGVHLEQRLEDGLYLEKPDIPIQKAIGKFHLGAHIDSCFSKFSLNFLLGAGHTDGEVLETLWAPLNKIAGSTRSMTLAHRQEVLDDSMYDSNWKKITNLVPSLIKKWRRAETSFEEMDAAYEDLRCRLSDNDLLLWDGQAEKASLLRGKALEIYDVKVEQYPSVASVRLNMVEQELESTSYVLGSAAFLTKGMSLEEAQLKLQATIHSLGSFPTVTQRNNLADRRRIMKKNIAEHRRQGGKLMLDNLALVNVEENNDTDSEDEYEEVGDDEDDGDDEYRPGSTAKGSKRVDEVKEAEHMEVCMPSTFSQEERTQIGWAKLAEQEVELREAQINDALHDLRIALGEKSLQFRKVLRGDRSQKHVSRAWSMINSYDDRANLQKWLPINRDHDLQMKGDVEHANRIGQSSHALAWFWRLQGSEVSDEVEDSPMMKEFYQINYLRAKARHDRWEEEMMLLKKEVTWTLAWFTYQADWWKVKGESDERQLSTGQQAFCRKMTAKWRDFRRRGVQAIQQSKESQLWVEE